MGEVGTVVGIEARYSVRTPSGRTWWYDVACMMRAPVRGRAAMTFAHPQHAHRLEVDPRTEYICDVCRAEAVQGHYRCFSCNWCTVPN